MKRSALWSENQTTKHSLPDLCQGRLKTVPVSPVEKWATSVGIGKRKCASAKVCAGAAEREAVGRARSGLSARGRRGGGSVFGRRSGEVAVFEAVAVAFEGEDVGVVNEPVDHRGGGDLVAEDLAPGEKGLLLVTISEARS